MHEHGPPAPPQKMAGKGTVELLKNAVVVNASIKHTATVLFLHGLGDTGDGWCSILEQQKQPYVKLICPTAPTMPVTANDGYTMPSWFDYFSFDVDARPDIEGIKSAAKKVHELLDYEIESTGIPAERIIVGGFSQGGSLGLLAALTYHKRLAGILGLSCCLENMENENIADKITVNKMTPFLQCHGEIDPVVPFELGRMSADFVATFNNSSYEFKPYPGLAHSSCPEELEYVQDWMNKLLPPACGKT